MKKVLLQEEMSEPTKSLPTEEAKLEKLQKQVEEQQAKVQDERNKIKTGAGMSVKEREQKAGKQAIEDLNRRQEMQREQVKEQNIKYEKFVKDMYQDADKKTLDKIDQQLEEREEVMDRQMKLSQKNQRRLMEKRVSCMQEVPGDQSSYQKERINSQEGVCKTDEEKAQIKAWYKDNRQVEKCMQPVVDANVERKIESRYQEENKELGEDEQLTKKEKAMVKEQMEAEKEMTDRLAKMAQAQQDRMVDNQFSCMAKVCGTKAGESEEQRHKRTEIQYQQCMQEHMIAEYSRAVDEAMGDIFSPRDTEESESPQVEKTKPAESKPEPPKKIVNTKVVVEKAKATKVTTVANTQQHSDKKAASTQTKNVEKKEKKPESDKAEQKENKPDNDKVEKKDKKTDKQSAGWMDPLKDILNR